MPGPLISDVVVFATSAQVEFWAVAVAALALVGFQVWAFIDVLRWPASAWDSSGLSQVRWVLRVVILGLVGSVWFVCSPRRKLRVADHLNRSGMTDPTLS